MPNDWELAHGLNPNDVADGNGIGQDGYTNPEVYLNTLTGELVTAADDLPTSTPVAFSLRQNFPNPFNPSTTIRHSRPERRADHSLRPPRS